MPSVLAASGYQASVHFPLIVIPAGPVAPESCMNSVSFLRPRQFAKIMVVEARGSATWGPEVTDV
jgi:hypothetical protein